MTDFISPLRRQWNRDKVKFEAQALGTGDMAVIARALLAFMPALCDFMEGELKRQTRPAMVMEGIEAAISNLAFQGISATIEPSDRRAALQILHRMIENDVGNRIDRSQTTGQIIMPGAMN